MQRADVIDALHTSQQFCCVLLQLPLVGAGQQHSAALGESGTAYMHCCSLSKGLFAYPFPHTPQCNRESVLNTTHQPQGGLLWS
jgi:hypothetical protein